MNKYQPLKVDAPAVTSQGTAFITDGKGGKGKVANKYLPKNEWNELSTEAKANSSRLARKVGQRNLTVMTSQF